MKETTRAGSRRYYTWRRFEFIRVDKILRAIGFGGSEAGNKESGDGFGGHCKRVLASLAVADGRGL